MMPQRSLEEAIQELYYWQGHDEEADWFTAKLYDLITKADRSNMIKLCAGFPAEVLAWHMWQDSRDEKEFFGEWLEREKSSGAGPAKSAPEEKA